MPADLLILRLLPEHGRITAHPSLRPLDASARDPLAAAYLAAYPPEVGAATLTEARQEMDDSFAGAYGVLRPDASWMAVLDGRVVGAIMVVERSIWDEELPGPFIIDLFLHPDALGRGLGRALIRAAVASCAQAGDATLALRFGEGTSASAHRLYAELGFTSAERA